MVLSVLFFMILFGLCSGENRQTQDTTAESELMTILFANYSLFHRPTRQVVVAMSLSLLTVNELNIKDQTMSVSGVLSLRWQDPRLQWLNNTRIVRDAQKFADIDFLFGSELTTWRPTIYIENSIQDLSVLSDPNIPLRLTPNGMVHWNPAGLFKVACESDITYYPLDHQTCSIKITTSSYTRNEIRLKCDDQPVILDYFSKNGEWELLSAQGFQESDSKRGGQEYSSITFELTLRRRYLFHVLNTIFPVALMSLLIPLVFKLSVDSGERIGYSLTVLLAYTVYLTMISDNIPSTSLSVCYISIYLAFTLALSTISVIFVIVVINVHHTPQSKPVPRCLIIFVLNVLARISCINGYFCCCNRNAKTQKRNIITPLAKIKRSISFEYYERKDPEMTWPMLASILDHFFFRFFMVLVIVSTITFISLIFSQYANSYATVNTSNSNNRYHFSTSPSNL